MNLNKLYQMRYYAESLMNGIDPTSRVEFKEDTILNMPQIRNFNSDVCSLIDSMIPAVSSVGERKRRKTPFFLMREDVEIFPYSAVPVSISELCYCMNKFILPGMSKLHAADLCKGLLNLGYLMEVTIDDDKSYKAPTLAGTSLGILKEERTNSYGNSYLVNLYNLNAQKYIVERLSEIIEEINKKQNVNNDD